MIYLTKTGSLKTVVSNERKGGGGLMAVFDSQAENFPIKKVKVHIQPKMNFVD